MNIFTKSVTYKVARAVSYIGRLYIHVGGNSNNYFISPWSWGRTILTSADNISILLLKTQVAGIPLASLDIPLLNYSYHYKDFFLLSDLDLPSLTPPQLFSPQYGKFCNLMLYVAIKIFEDH